MNMTTAVERFLDQHYKHSARPGIKSLMNNKQMSMCLAEIVFSSLLFGDHDKYFEVDVCAVDCLVGYCPVLAAHEYTGFYAFGDVGVKASTDIANSAYVEIHTNPQVLADEEKATRDLCEEIQTNAEVALICWTLAKQIAQSGALWTQEDYTYDCMVQLGLLPMYEGFETVCEVGDE